MTRPRRPELDVLGQIVSRLRYRAIRAVDDDPGRTIWSIAIIDDLRPRAEFDVDTRGSSNAST